MTTDQLVTADAIADLLLEYAMVLGRADDSDTVVLPVVRNGEVEEASILLGPASQITLTASHDETDNAVQIPNVDAVSADLKERIARRSGTHPAAVEDDVRMNQAFTDFDDF
jgi:hypothetical protein